MLRLRCLFSDNDGERGTRGDANTSFHLATKTAHATAHRLATLGTPRLDRDLGHAAWQCEVFHLTREREDLGPLGAVGYASPGLAQLVNQHSAATHGRLAACPRILI